MTVVKERLVQEITYGRIIRKRKSGGHYHALLGNYESDGEFLLAEVVKENLNGKMFWRVYLTSDTVNQSEVSQSPTVWQPQTPTAKYVDGLGFETLNSAFDSLNANF
ncbi:hypothetical protein AGMMS49975_13860 [Clostridia bacterium]|nr:hypothetical protein AGMMS49975_13860 [Clostridia bacterium]